MNGLPYYKRYPRDFIEGTLGMPFELKGAYSVVLDLIYLQGGKLHDDPRYISGVLGVSIRKWNSLREQLVERGKLQVTGEFLTNYRSDKETEMLRSFQDKQSENASRPRKNKHLAKAMAKPKVSHTEPEPEPEKENKFSFLYDEEFPDEARRAAERFNSRRMDRQNSESKVVPLPQRLEGGSGDD